MGRLEESTTQGRVVGKAKLLLRRGYPTEPWQLLWPNGIQQASMCSLTHDEVRRLGMSKALQSRSGTIRVMLRITEIPISDADPVVEEDVEQWSE